MGQSVVQAAFNNNREDVKMQISLVTLAFDPATGGFPQAPLKEIEGEIVNVVEHFFHFEEVPRLLLVVHHREQPRSGGKSKRLVVGDLPPEDRELYKRLSAWRLGRSQADGVPVYIIFTNRHLADLARRRPRSNRELVEVRGVGEAKAGQYGAEVLKVVSQYLSAEDTQEAPKKDDV
ncbi:hypothetical protein AB833_26745 [Chromatiales bacterium (ex Bugula neritina AB1)]|nr:hypothetical protein AB833_26745 [Chromatiales bacterium (ex Bugula neritina AB1)]